MKLFKFIRILTFEIMTKLPYDNICTILQMKYAGSSNCRGSKTE